MRPFSHTPLLSTLLVVGLCAVTSRNALAGRRVPQASNNKPSSPKTSAQPSKPKGLTIAGLNITGMRSQTITNNFSKIILTGPDVRVEGTDRTRGTHLVILADQVVGQRQPKNQDVADCTGHVRYTITEQTKTGPHVLQGTAQEVIYIEASQTLSLTNDVNLTLTDPARFDGPATLHVASLIMPGEGHYKLKGDPGSTDIRFTPHYMPPKATPGTQKAAPGAKSGEPKQPGMASQVGNVHIHGFATGTLNVGADLHFDGPLVTIETNNPQTKTQNTLKAPHISAVQEKPKEPSKATGSAPTDNPPQEHIEATGGVQFDNQTIDTKGTMQRLAGTTNQAVYDGAAGQLDLEGNVNASLTNPRVLKEPATLAGGHLRIEVSEEPRYILTGSPDRTRLTFAPKPAKKKMAGGPLAAPHNAPAPSNTVPDKSGVPANNAVPNANAAPVSANAAKAEDGGQQEDAEPILPPNPKGQNENVPFAFGNIVVSAFQTATYAPGKSVVVEGPKVHFTSFDPVTKSYGEIVTPHLVADFDEDDSAFTEARATGSVAYKFTQPLKSGKDIQSITGTGRTAAFTDNDQGKMIRVEGIDKMEIVNPILFDEASTYASTSPDDLLTYDLINRDFSVLNPNKDGVWKIYPHTPPEPVKPISAKTKQKRKHAPIKK